MFSWQVLNPKKKGKKKKKKYLNSGTVSQYAAHLKRGLYFKQKSEVGRKRHGSLSLIYSFIFSMGLIQELFARCENWGIHTFPQPMRKWAWFRVMLLLKVEWLGLHRHEREVLNDGCCVRPEGRRTSCKTFLAQHPHEKNKSNCPKIHNRCYQIPSKV